MSDKNNFSNDINSRFSRPLLIAIAIAFVFGCGGIEFALTRVVDPNLKAALINASIVLIFGALLGGIVKLLIDDHQKLQEQRANQAQFLTNVLADLKAVYDRVERARILIPAHKSAKTYGDEMRDLIEARVQLRNVIRALGRGTGGLPRKQREQIRLAVRTMESYLAKLTHAFKRDYIKASRRQKVYETEVERIVKDEDADPPEIKEIKNEAWKIILEMPETKGFLGYKLADENDSTAEPEDFGYIQIESENKEYTRCFERPLDIATWILRNELQVTLGSKRDPIPDDYTADLESLERSRQQTKEDEYNLP